MKALMFGWEFPPHILGGLGTASYGLTKGMWENGDMDITFVIPKPWGDEPKDFANIIGANSTPVAWRDVNWDYVQSRIGDVMDPQMYFNLRDHIYGDFNYMSTNDLGCIEFSGRYPENLLEEINNYSIVALYCLKFAGRRHGIRFHRRRGTPHRRHPPIAAPATAHSTPKDCLDEVSCDTPDIRAGVPCLRHHGAGGGAVRQRVSSRLRASSLRAQG